MEMLDVTCPPGLQWLRNLSKLYILRNTETLPGLLQPWDTKKSYRIVSETGQIIFYAAEDSNVCCICCCRNKRPWEFKFYDINMDEVFTISRPFPWFLEKAVVHARGVDVGYVTQNFNPLRPSFNIRDHTNKTVLRIKGPYCWGCDCLDVTFQIKSAVRDEQIGIITKEWTSLGNEILDSGNVFCVNCPADLDIKAKGLLIATSVLLDFMRWTRE